MYRKGSSGHIRAAAYTRSGHLVCYSHRERRSQKRVRSSPVRTFTVIALTGPVRPRYPRISPRPILEQTRLGRLVCPSNTYSAIRQSAQVMYLKIERAYMMNALTLPHSDLCWIALCENGGVLVHGNKLA